MATTEMTGRTRRIRGALIGLATGDALGTTVEFKAPGTFAPVTDMVGGGVFNLQAGEWTDDTAMALCLAESLISCGGFDAADQMQRYVRWMQHGHFSVKGYCFDIGSTTSAALNRFIQTGDPYAGVPNGAGNGSLMRLAPIPMVYARSSRLAQYCADSSRTTHGAPQAIDACVVFGRLVAAAINGATRDALLKHLEALVETDLHPEIANIVRGSFLYKQPPDIVGMGYVVPALEAALWAFFNTHDYRACVLAATNLGDDADTTAAIAGQLAGAFYGEQAIPAAWRAKLAMGDTIDKLATGLVTLEARLAATESGAAANL